MAVVTFKIRTVSREAWGTEGAFGLLAQLSPLVPAGSLSDWKFGVDLGLVIALFNARTSVSLRFPGFDSVRKFSFFILLFANVFLITELSTHPVSQWSDRSRSPGVVAQYADIGPESATNWVRFRPGPVPGRHPVLGGGIGGLRQLGAEPAH